MSESEFYGLVALVLASSAAAYAIGYMVGAIRERERIYRALEAAHGIKENA